MSKKDEPTPTEVSTDSGFGSQAPTNPASGTGTQGHRTNPTSTASDSGESSKGSASEAPSGADPNNVKAAIILKKPISGSCLGTVWVDFKQPPQFHAFRIIVQSHGQPLDGTPAEGSPIKSQKLRRAAIQSFVQSVFQAIGTSFAINTRTGMDWDHILFPYSTDHQRKSIISNMTDKYADKLEGVTKMPKRGSGGHEESISCHVHLISNEEFESKKAENLNILMHTLAQGRSSRDYQVSKREFLRPIAGPFNRIDVAMTHDKSAATLTASSMYEVQLRQRFALSSDQKGVRFHLDLVPIIPTKLLSEVVLDILGGIPTVQDKIFARHPQPEKDLLLMMKHMLRGLNVHCSYIPHNRSLARMLDEETSSEGRCFQIKDVKYPGSDTEFEVDGTKYNVTSYFQQVILGGKLLKFPHWPVAVDDKGYCFPLEMLYVGSGQVLSRCGHLKQALLSRARKLTNTAGASWMCQQAKQVFNKFAETKLEPDTRWLKAVQIKDFGFDSNPDFVVPTKTANDDLQDAPDIALLFIAPNGEKSGKSAVFDRIKRGLAGDYTCSEEILEEDDVLFLKTSLHDFFKKVSGTSQKLVFAVTSDSGLATSDTEPMFARLRRCCESRHGLMLICQTGSGLAKFFQKSKGPADRCPVGFRRQIDFMLGHSNFNNEKMDTSHLKDCMVIGAHIMHKNLSREGALLYSPSVASVVASTDSIALSFPGSARFQRTTIDIVRPRPDERKIKKKRMPGEWVVDLREMLLERFQAWTDSEKPPTSILLYRDSMGCDDHLAAAQECSIIEEAYQLFTGSETVPKITYIVVSKSFDLDYSPEYPDRAAKFVGDFVIQPGKAKNKFYIMRNDNDWNVVDLQTMTRDLNNSNQLSAHFDQVAKVLPITWATKLCNRMYEYIVSVHPNELSLTELKRPKKPDESEIEHENEAVTAVNTFFNIGGRNARQLPWNEKLDKTMFYL